MKKYQENRKVLRLLLAMVALLALAFVATPAMGQLLTDADVEKIFADNPSDQPIKFSHKIHVAQDKIDCQYCHIYARRSASSGAPPVAICMGCHKVINPALKEIQKVHKYWNDKEPIPWVKIHDVPDFVRYIHEPHINAKNEVFPNGVACEECHGDVGSMDVVKKVNPDFGKMGWCLTCHLKIPGAKERKQAIAVSFGSMELKNFKHPSGDYTRPNLSDCLTCHK